MRLPVACRRSLFVLAAALVVLHPTTAVVAEDNTKQLLATSRDLVRDAADYRFRRWLRDRIWREDDEARYGLQLEKGWERVAAQAAERPLVVLVHGFNSTPLRNDAVLVPIRAAGYPCAAFAYPNDWEIEECAALLSRQLRAFSKEHPGQKIALLTHSMGGIVARACLEAEDLDPGNVSRLIMIAPPSQGTMLAHFAIATDIWEHWLNRPDGGCWARWRDSVVDGLGEAADDLLPGCEFLTKLNAGPRNPRVKYTILLGTGASVEHDEMYWIRTALQETSGRCPGFRHCTDRLDNLLSEMDEIVDGKGDGVVAVKRGRLEGVDDVVLLPFGHLSCTGPAECKAVKQVQHEVLARLR